MRHLKKLLIKDDFKTFFNTIRDQTARFKIKFSDVNKVDDEGCTLLHVACSKNNLEAVQTLLTIGCDITIKNKAKKIAAELTESKDIKQLLNDATIACEIWCDREYNIDKLIAEGFDLGAEFKMRTVLNITHPANALTVAAFTGKLKVVQKILKNRAYDLFGDAMYIARVKGHEAILNLLLVLEQVYDNGYLGSTGLYNAIRANDHDSIKFLVTYSDHDINGLYDDLLIAGLYTTALSYAFVMASVETFNLLLMLGADPKDTVILRQCSLSLDDSEKLTQLLSHFDNAEELEKTLEADKYLEAKRKETIMQVFKKSKNSKPSVQSITIFKTIAKTKTDDNEQALYLSAKKNRIGDVKIQIDNDATILPRHFYAAGSAKSTNIFKLLHIAYQEQHSEYTLPLKLKSAECLDLINVVKEGNANLVRMYIMEKSFDPNVKNGELLYVAIDKRNDEIIDILIANDCTILPKHFFATGFRRNQDVYSKIKTVYLTQQQKIKQAEAEHEKWNGKSGAKGGIPVLRRF